MVKKRERKCAKCGTTSGEDSSVAFHRIPRSSERGSLRARIWAIYCFPDNDWNSKESLKMLRNRYYICSKHFDDSSYVSSDRSRLNAFAIPFDAQHILCDLRDKLQSEQKIIDETTVHTANVTAQQLEVAAVGDVADQVPHLDTEPAELEKGDVADQVPHLDTEPAELEKEEGEVPNYTPKENVFSWEVISDAVSIPQDEPEQLDDDRDDLSMYCDDDAAKYINSTGFHEGFHCDNCNGDIIGYRYTCVQCSELDLCTSCESNGAHAQHYMLRVPGPRPYNEIQSVLVRIRKLLMKEFDPISAGDLDYEDIISLKSEVKSEDEQENFEDVEQIDDITEHEVELETEELSRLTSPEPQCSENANSDVVMENNLPIEHQIKNLNTSLINEQENQKLSVVESTDNVESTLANTAKRKLVVRLSDCVKLNESSQLGKKLCIAPSTSIQDIKETNTILSNRTVLDSSEVKYVTLAPGALLNLGQRVIESTDNVESTLANTAKRKLVVRLSDCVKLNESSQLGKKLCIAPNTSIQDIKETNTIPCNRIVLDRSEVKYVTLAPGALLNLGQAVPLQIRSPWKPQTNSADGNS